MCIYCGTNKYRKIYEHHYGKIPKESNNRSYEIHHIDGNHSNNDPSNLKAVTIQEHYDIHYSQGDYNACYWMAIQRMNKNPEELSILKRSGHLTRLRLGTHHLQKRDDGTSVASDSYANGRISNFRTMTKENHHRYDSTIYCFENKITGEKINSTRYEFIRNNDVHESHITNLIHGKRKSHKGWKLSSN
jgi:hypothetical protein